MAKKVTIKRFVGCLRELTVGNRSLKDLVILCYGNDNDTNRSCFNRDILPLLKKTEFIDIRCQDIPIFTRAGTQKLYRNGKPMTRKSGKSKELSINKNHLFLVWKKAQSSSLIFSISQFTKRKRDFKHKGIRIRSGFVKQNKDGTHTIIAKSDKIKGNVLTKKLEPLSLMRDVPEIEELGKINIFKDFLILYLKLMLNEDSENMPQINKILGNDFILALGNEKVLKGIKKVPKVKTKMKVLSKPLLRYSELLKEDSIVPKSIETMQLAIAFL